MYNFQVHFHFFLFTFCNFQDFFDQQKEQHLLEIESLLTF